MRKKRWASGFFSGLSALSLIVILLMTAFQIGMYGDFGFYEKEYKKYEIQNDLPMEMEDIMDVTKQMMAYLKGDKKELSVYTTIGGERQDFFNEQDRFHMGEVKELFLGGFALRRYAAAVFVVSIVALVLMKADLRRLLPKAYEITVGIFLGLSAAFGVAIALNFNRCFVLFHEIFFDNDLWIFDPAEDYMIRMLPEGFFFDMTLRIGGLFIGMLFFFLLISVAVQVYDRRKIRKSYK